VITPRPTVAIARSVTLAACVALGCGSSDEPTDAGSDAGESDGAREDAASDAGVPACALAASTSPTGVTTNGCALLDRDTSSCRAARQGQGLGGLWLAFSCRVSLEKTSVGGKDVVRVRADGQPDYPSAYFPMSDPCWTARTSGLQNPNRIAAKSMQMDVPLATSGSATATGLGPVGLAVNGVALFDNRAAPGDDIFLEARTFDACGGHPSPDGSYHYHSEPYAISYDDARLIGVLRDGSPVYGRRDADGSTPALDADGGHMGTTADSPTAAVYHFHVNPQTSTAGTSAGQTQFFLTKGRYHGAPGTCTGC